MTQSKTDLRVVFMGTPDLARTVLEKVLEDGYKVVAAVTQTDKPKGRGGQMAFSPVKELCLEKNIAVIQPEKAKSDEFYEELKACRPDIILVAAYGKILPKRVLDLPKYGCINVHTSLLPDYRGAAPIQWAVLNGEKKTGVTIMYMDEGCDTGDIISQREVLLAEDETGGSLHDKLAELGGQLLVETLPSILDGSAVRTKQDHSKTRYVGLIEKSLGNLNFERPAEELERYVRGLDPWPGAFTYIDGKLMKIWKAEVIKEDTSENMKADAAASQNCNKPLPGTILESNGKTLNFATGDGILAVTELQPEGKKRMPAAAYLNGLKGKQ